MSPTTRISQQRSTREHRRCRCPGRNRLGAGALREQAPFRVLDSTGGATSYAAGREVANAIRTKRLGSRFEVAIGAKVRPVLLLQDRPEGKLPEYAALKLTRLGKLSEEDRAVVRDQQLRRFFHIEDPKKFGLNAEFAVDLLSLVRVHQSAIVSRPEGKVNADEFRVICERMIRAMDLDIATLVVREAADFLKRQGLGH